MYTVESIYEIIITICITAGMTYFSLVKIKINPLKIMLLGIGMMLFGGIVLNNMVRYGLDDVLSVIGFGILLGGLFKRDLSGKM